MKILIEQIRLPQNDLRATVDEDAIEELAESLRDLGQLQPIGVLRHTGTEFEVVYGARRYRAAKLLGWQTIEATFVEDGDEQTRAAKKLVENVHREALTPTEEAYGLAALMTGEDTTVRELRRRTGKSAAWIKSRLEILEMPEDMQGHVHAGRLGLTVARELAEITSPEIRDQYVQHAVNYGCTADKARQWAETAVFAEAGIMAAQAADEDGNVEMPEPQFIETKYTCFVCTEQRTYRQINTLAICGQCQAAVLSTRDRARDRAQLPPIDSTENLRDNAAER